MTVLVTGGAGYIGSHVARSLVDRGDQVVVLDLLVTGRREAVPPGATLVIGDVRDEAFVRETLERHAVDAVLHLAGLKSVEASMRDPGATFSTNVLGSLAMLEAMSACGIDRIAFSSTAAVYGTPDSLPVDEDAPLQPENPYGESKAQVEALLGWYGKLRAIRSVSLRYFNAAGADPTGGIGEDWAAATNLVPIALRAASTGEALTVFGTDYPTPDGTPVRDYVHVLDIARAHLLALDYLASNGSSVIVNLGTGSGVSVSQVIAAARQVTGREIHVSETRRQGDPAAIWADPRRAASILGWEAHLGLETMLADAWRWHTDGARPVAARR